MDNNSVNNIIERLYDGFWQNKTYWPYQIELKEWNQYNEAEKFCYKHFKSRNWRSQGVYFSFKRKEDYEWFLLRWQ